MTELQKDNCYAHLITRFDGTDFPGYRRRRFMELVKGFTRADNAFTDHFRILDHVLECGHTT